MLIDLQYFSLILKSGVALNKQCPDFIFKNHNPKKLKTTNLKAVIDNFIDGDRNLIYLILSWKKFQTQ